MTDILVETNELKRPAFLLIGINARYSHTNIAIRYLANTLRQNGFKADIHEQSINIPYGQLLREIAVRVSDYDVIGFSTYIWNVELIRKLSQDLSQLLPEKIWMAGGPEVTYDPKSEFLNGLDVDVILAGEGEESIVQLGVALVGLPLEAKGMFLPELSTKVSGLFTRIGSSSECAFPVVTDLSGLTFPYGDEEPLDHRILYYESSRGCPYNCSYCLSSTLKGVRFKPLEEVYSDMDWFIKRHVMQVKFVDRTFNADKERTHALLKYIADNDNGHTQFHFELTAALIDDEMIELLSNVRPGLFQFELGIQTTKSETALEIHRVQSLDKTLQRCRDLVVIGRQHIHVDLIAGLPYDTPESFYSAIDTCLSVAPHMLQIGFLKLLKGSEIRIRSSEYGYIHSKTAPYEVLSSSTMGFYDLQEIKKLEEIVDKFYNSGVLRLPLRLVGLLLSGRYADFLKKIVLYSEQNGCFERQVKMEEWMEHIRMVTWQEFKETGYADAILEFMDRQAARFGVPGAAERLGSQDANLRQRVFETLHEFRPFSDHQVLGKLQIKDQFKKITAIMTKCDGDVIENMLESDREPDEKSLLSMLECKGVEGYSIELIDKTAKHPFSGMYPILKVPGIQYNQE